MLKIISVSRSMLQITKLWVNLNSAVLKCKAVIPRAVLGEPSAVFNLAVVSISMVCQLLSRLMPYSIYQYELLSWAIHYACHSDCFFHGLPSLFIEYTTKRGFFCLNHLQNHLRCPLNYNNLIEGHQL